MDPRAFKKPKKIIHKSPVCEFCNESFPSTTILMAHQKKHTQEERTNPKPKLKVADRALALIYQKRNKCT